MRAHAPKLGFTLSSEENAPADLVRYAAIAEDAGLDFLMATDHFHPWIDRQGQSPFVWSVLGGVASVTRSIKLGTGVTCPSMRIHPAIIAHASATVAAMMPGRFTLGLGSGEALNEHVTGEHWPTAGVRLDRLEEAIHIIRRLWTGDQITYHGNHFTVESARLYTLPASPPPIVVAATGPKSSRIARDNDGLVVTGPNSGPIESVRSEQPGAAIYGQITLCWDPDEQTARETALEWWPISALSWPLRTNLASPDLLDDAVQHIDMESVTQKIVCTSQPEPIIESIQTYADAGINHIYMHQVGPRQQEFLDFFARELRPALAQTVDARA